MGYKNKKVFITGASGFAGTELCRVLLKKGAYVTGLARKFSKERHKELISNPKFAGYEEDILNIKKLEKILKKQDIVFHLAAQPYVFYSNKHPLEDFKINVAGTVMLLDIIKESKTKLIYPSSIAVYDGKKKGKYTENEANPVNFYALSKLTCERYIKQFCRLFGLNAAVLRIGYIYGRGMTRGPIFDAFGALLKGKDEVAVYTSPDDRLDFIYIDDVINALLLAGEMKKSSGEVINIGNGCGIKVKEVIKEAGYLFRKKNIRIKLHKDAKKTSVNRVLNSKKAEKLIGWKPRYSLKEGLAKTYELLKKNEKNTCW